MAESDSIYVAAEHRIEWMTLAFGLAGAVFVLLRWGWRPGAGVALGAALAWLNFRWLKQGVDRSRQAFDRAGGFGTCPRACERLR